MSEFQPLTQAIEHHKMGNWAEAEKIYCALLLEEPNDPEILHLLAILYGQNNQLERAQLHINHALTMIQQPSFFVTAGNIARQRKDWNLAEQHFHKALALHPKHATAHHNLAVMYSHQKRMDDAIKHFKLAIELKPNYEEAYLNLGVAYASHGRLDLALTTLKKGCQIDPNHPILWLNYAQICQKEMKLDAAISAYQKAISLNPKHAATHDLLGTAYAQQQKLDEAFDAFVIALKIDPKHAPAMHNLASLHFRERRFDKALKYWLNMLNVAPDADTHFNIAACYESLKRWQAAKTYLLCSLAARPDHIPTLINLASWHIKHGKTQDAINLYKKILKLDPKHPQVSFVLSALEQSDATNFKRAPDDYVQHLFNAYADTFDSHLQDTLSYHVPQCIEQLLLEHIAPHGQLHVLDLGCGTGLCGEKLHPWCKHLIGVDLSDQMLQQARKKNIYDALIESEITTYMKQDHTYDLIVAGDVMPYFGDLHEIFTHTRQCMQHHGYFIFTIECSEGLYPFQLSTSARFKHDLNYILEIATQASWQHIEHQSIVSRTQHHQPVKGHLICLQAS